MKKAKSPLLFSLKRAFDLARLSLQPNQPPVEQLVATYEANRQTRRNFLGNITKAGVALSTSSLIGSSLVSCNAPLPEPTQTFSHSAAKKGKEQSVAVIGAGMAGLNAAYQLKKQGVIASVYEAASSAGGRIKTAYNVFGTGLYTEIGGEFIDSIHEDMLGLAAEFGLPLLDTDTDPLTKDIFFINNVTYSLAQVTSAFQAAAPIIENDYNSLNDNANNGAARRIDKTSLKDYVDNLPLPNWMKTMLNQAYVAEYGLEAEEQSALNFVFLIGTEPNTFEIFGVSDERYKIEGGNSRLIVELTNRLSGQINYNCRLIALKEKNKEYELTFDNGDTVKADIVIMTLPFSILRNVQLSLNGLTPDKKKCIQELGYGTNAKLILGFNEKIWRQEGYQGGMYNEKIQNGWDSSQLQSNPLASYTVFVGGAAGVTMSQNANNPDVEVAKYLPTLESAYGNRTGKYNNNKTIANWPDNPNVKASYACYKVGQYVPFAKVVAAPVGNVFFAGEHTSDEFQGYMNGAAETGRIAAEDVLKKLKIAV